MDDSDSRKLFLSHDYYNVGLIFGFDHFKVKPARNQKDENRQRRRQSKRKFV